MATKKIVSAAAAVATTLATLSPAFAANFADVKDDASYAKSVNRLKALGIVSGDTKGNFNPDLNLERAQAAKLLVGALAQANAAVGENKFSDVSGWATKFVNIAAAQGYVNGYGNGKFGPTDKVTNAQFLAMTLRALGKSDSALGLDSKTKWADKVTKYLAEAKDAKLLDGLGDLDPSAAAKRSDIAVIVNNLLNTDVDGSTLYENVKKELGVQIVNGTVDSVDGNTVVVAGKAYTVDSVPANVKTGSIVKFDAKDDTAVSDVVVVKESTTAVGLTYAVTTIAPVDNTHIAVTFDAVAQNISASDFTFDGGLVASDAKVDGKVVTLTTSAQKADKYILSYNGKVAGAFTGTAPTVIPATTQPTLNTITSFKPDGIALANQTVAGNNYAVKSVQAIVGGKVVLTAKTTPNATLTFKVMTPNGSLNTQYSKDVVADANGIATFDYSRSSADADTIIIAAKGNETLQDIAKVYWGIKQIVTVTPDITTPTSGGTVNYSVKLTNPITGEVMTGKTLKVLFKENVGQEGIHATATTIGYTAGQRLYQDVKSSTNDTTPRLTNTLAITTDANGVAKFNVTANHESATPIVFYDYRTFFGEGLYDSAQYLSSFAGNGNDKFDPLELNAFADTVNFVNNKYTITSAETDAVYASTNYTTGRKYTITVKNANGTVAKGAIANVAINQLVSGYDSRARIVAVNSKDGNQPKDLGLTDRFNFGDTTAVLSQYIADPSSDTAIKDGVTISSKYIKVAVKLDDNGQANFIIASDRENTVVAPTVWIDGDTPDQYTGRTNGIYDATLDNKQDLATTSFVKSLVVDGLLTVNDDSAKDYTSNASVSGGTSTANFYYNLVNQNGDKLGEVYSGRINFVVTNNSSKDITVVVPLSNRVVDQVDLGAQNTVVVKPYQTRTIGADLPASTSKVNVLQVSGVKDAKVSVNATAILNVAANSTDNKYTTSQTATASFGESITFAVSKVTNYDYVGLLDDVQDGNGVVTYDADLTAASPKLRGNVRLNLPEGRYILFNLNDGTIVGGNVSINAATKIYAGLVTAISSTANLNDFNQATILTDDVKYDVNNKEIPNAKTRYQKLIFALGKGVAVDVKFSTINPDVIDTLKVLYTSAQYKGDRAVSTTAGTVAATAASFTIPTYTKDTTVYNGVTYGLINFNIPVPAGKAIYVVPSSLASTNLTAAQLEALYKGGSATKAISGDTNAITTFAAEGTYTVYTLDLLSGTSNLNNVIFDKTAPKLSNIAPSFTDSNLNGVVDAGEKIVVNFSSNEELGSGTKVTFGNVDVIATNLGGNNFTAAYTATAPVPTTYTIVGVDKAGNAVTTNGVLAGAVTIASVAPVAVTTTAGTAPVLPATVAITNSNATTGTASVTWDAIDATKYAVAAAGTTFTVNGTVAGTALKATATVTVTVVNPQPQPQVKFGTPQYLGLGLSGILTGTITDGASSVKTVKVTAGSILLGTGNVDASGKFVVSTNDDPATGTVLTISAFAADGTTVLGTTNYTR